ncbi:Ferritin-like domain-containing protein [Hymenobacter gelipurpurascens]|uniref:Ferritin-like domain-containing protein n=1 Tax=Hymenobacter gelipurpurascens TaxID=89968 RepID=A0A212UGM4_9BACT|nr:ferritin-like domain-containing protein [Hymenobacter gelipurpurascens]SNC77402.1 Ferritin-like domain-containing protein [Hymenobacter gelipurpurascens]
MSKIHDLGASDQANNSLLQPLQRRSFLRYTGAGLAMSGLLLAGCDDDEDTIDSGNFIDVGTGDFGVLNYAYALEQLEAAFYAQVKTGKYYTDLAASSSEKQIFDDLALHEKAHAEFFKTALAANAIKALEADFSSINFNDRTSVLNAAKSFEDLGVAAYNGAGRYIQTAAYLVVAGKIVSVEARHAALIRDLISYNSFVDTDVVDLFTPTSATSAPGEGNGTGLERSMKPSDVLTKANTFLKEGSRLSANNLK